MKEYDNYQLVIKALGKDSEFTLDGEAITVTYTYGPSGENSGDTFTKILAPSFSYNNGKVQLTGNEDAKSYEIYSFDGETYTLLTYEYSIDGDGYVYLTNADTTYDLVAKAIAKDEIGKLNSDYSNPIKVNKLLDINGLNINATGVISWNANANATKYLIYNSTTGQSLVIDGQATNSVDYETL